MNIIDARKLLTHRHSRIHDTNGDTYIGLSLEDAEAIAGLLPAGDPPATVPPKPASEPEKAVEAKPEPVRAVQKKGRRKGR